MEDFKLQFYFNLYKDKAMITRSLFRIEFIKRHGEFKYLEELIRMIEYYQINKQVLKDFNISSESQLKYIIKQLNVA